MKYLFRGGAMVAFVTAAALLGGGCARGGARAPAVEEADLTVGAVPVADSAALYIAWERANPATAAAFRRALLAGQKIAAANPPAVWNGLEKFAKIPVSAADLIALPSYPLTITAGTLQRIAGLMETFDMLSHGYDASQMLR